MAKSNLHKQAVRSRTIQHEPQHLKAAWLQPCNVTISTPREVNSLEERIPAKDSRADRAVYLEHLSYMRRIVARQLRRAPARQYLPPEKRTTVSRLTRCAR